MIDEVQYGAAWRRLAASEGHFGRVPSNSRGEHLTPARGAEIRDQIAKMAQRGKTRIEIARAIGCCIDTVNNHARKSGILIKRPDGVWK